MAMLALASSVNTRIDKAPRCPWRYSSSVARRAVFEHLAERCRDETRDHETHALLDPDTEERQHAGNIQQQALAPQRVNGKHEYG
jgi:hypothetical protein